MRKCEWNQLGPRFHRSHSRRLQLWACWNLANDWLWRAPWSKAICRSSSAGHWTVVRSYLQLAPVQHNHHHHNNRINWLWKQFKSILTRVCWASIHCDQFIRATTRAAYVIPNCPIGLFLNRNSSSFRVHPKVQTDCYSSTYHLNGLTHTHLCTLQHLLALFFVFIFVKS